MKLTENSDVVKTIRRGDIYFCCLSSPADEELKHNQYLLGKVRPCLIIGNDSQISYPFYHVIPIRSNVENDLTNKENMIPICLEDDHDSVLDFSQARPVHINLIRDYIGTIYDDELMSKIEMKLIENYDLMKNAIYINRSCLNYKNDAYELLKKVINSVIDGINKGVTVHVNVSYQDGSNKNNYEIKRPKTSYNKKDYLTWNEEDMREFLSFENLGIASVEQLKHEGYDFNSIYEIKRCIWYCKHKLGCK